MLGYRYSCAQNVGELLDSYWEITDRFQVSVCDPALTDWW